MKKILLILNIVFLLTAWQGYIFYRSTPPRKDYSGYAENIVASKSVALKPVPTRKQINVIDVKRVVDANLFEPQRGVVNTADAPPPKIEKKVVNSRRPNLILKGICQVQGRAGAIIIDNARRLVHRPPTRTRSRISRHRPVPVKPKVVPPQQGSKSCYYRIGDSLPCGYTLKEIKVDSVLLVQGNNSFELKLEDTEQAKGAVALPPKRIISQSGGGTSHRATSRNINNKRNINNVGKYKK